MHVEKEQLGVGEGRQIKMSRLFSSRTMKIGPAAVCNMYSTGYSITILYPYGTYGVDRAVYSPRLSIDGLLKLK